MTVTIRAINRFPIKGLSAEPLESVELSPGLPLPHDRRFAIAHGSAPIDPANPVWLSKAHFLQLMSNPRLAALGINYDAASTTLTITRGGRPVARGDLSNQMGRTVIEQFFSAFMKADLRGAPKLVDRGDHAFSDADAPFVSILNAASITDLERVVGQPVDPIRFRGNILVDGGPPWIEAAWVGHRVRLGSAELKIMEAIGRCAATNVDPNTGARDRTIPRDLRHGFGHEQCGVYAQVVAGGRVAVGDAVEIVD
ncbi:MAG: MOSC domain-containing protein [Alphaproteobacteria bacterium]|nr:MOSC domain-containing protein [Alphaproteobacteria bacterium]